VNIGNGQYAVLSAVVFAIGLYGVFARRHPLADEVLTLTNVYLEARFGGAALSEGGRRDFERRVRDIRGYRAAPTG